MDAVYGQHPSFYFPTIFTHRKEEGGRRKEEGGRTRDAMG